MTPHVYIRDIGGHEGQDVLLKGWLYNKRGSKALRFLEIRDGTGIIQGVVTKGEIPDAVWDVVDTLDQEASIEVTGNVVQDARSKIGFEVRVKDLQLVCRGNDYPITPKEHGVHYLMEHRHLWLRSKRQVAIMHVRHTIIAAIRDYFNNHGFTLVDAPIFTPAACEGTSTLFELPYFDLGNAYLTQSGQLYMEAAAAALGKVYCFGPTFRAEKSKTRRHLAEFWMVEPEVAFATHDDNVALAEDFLVYVVGRAVEQHRDDLALLERDVKPLEAVQKPFPRLSYTQAVEQLHKLGSDIKWGDDMGGDDETLLTKEYDRPIMVDRYPTAAKAFYMKRDPQNPDVVLCLDVLAPEGYGEVIGGGTREENIDVLLASLKHHNLPEEAFKWYLDLRRHGSVPHAGFGLGVERTVAWVCGLQHVRETIPFARMMERITP